MSSSLRPLFQVVILGSCIAAALPLAAQTYTASPILETNYSAVPYSYTGMLRTAPNSEGFLYSGSGAVVKNPRVVYSCAHVVFEGTAIDPWLSGIRWHRAWASSSAPPTTGGQLLRSYYFFLGYASAAKISDTSFDAFSMDFVVHYAYEVTANGGYAGVFEDGGAQLRSTRMKLITGYPTGNYPIGDSRRYLMHNTGPFSRSFTVRKEDYHGIAEVSTGSGNSGGPVWVNDGTQYAFAGVLVSGLVRSAGDSTDSAGVFAIDSSSASLVDAAIAASANTIASPTITSQPTSRRVTAGQSAAFSVSASGANLVYRWLFNRALLPGETGATLSLASVSLAHAGTYQAIVSNSGGETRSTVVTLAVDSPAGFSMYASESTSPARLFRVNSSSGATTLISSTGFVPGLDFRANGVLYGSSSSLSTVSTTTGVTTVIGRLPDLIVSIAFSPSDELYGVTNSGSLLYKIDPNTGQSLGSVPISGTTLPDGTTFPAEIRGIDFGPDGRLYGIGLGLYSINPATGSATRITPANLTAGGASNIFTELDFGPDGLLRAPTFGTTSNLYLINPVTGIGQLLGPMGALVGGVATIPDGPATTSPAITIQPAAVAVNLGQSATFSVTATGTGPLAYQWRKDGTAIAGATNASFAISNVQAGNTGSYSVVVSNAAGTVTSSAVSLVVNTLPVITTQPIAAQSVAAGKAVTFSVTTAGTPPPTYQWRKDGVNISGATGSSWTLGSAQPSDAGTYTVVVSNGAGSVTSSVGTLSVAFSRLVNLSILTSISSAGDAFTMGYVIAGAANNTQALVIRAAGPSLGALGVPNTLDDPKTEYFRGPSKIGENDNWAGSAALVNAMAGVGAFAYVGPTSRDSAAAMSVAVGDNSVKVSAAGNGTGTVIAEIYDATPAANISSTAPRLANVSVLKQLETGFTVGFVLGGTGSKGVLVRAVGPTLGTAFGVGGVVGDPQLSLYAGPAVLATNDNWGGGSSLATSFSSVGAFDLPAASRDAAIVANLNPGSYTVQVSGVSGASGLILVEIYELP